MVVEELGVARLAAALRAGELSPSEAVHAYLERIERIEPLVHAYITVRADEALAEAKALEGARERGPLWGVPVAVKDMIDVAGTRTTASSKILADNVAASDAHVVERLRAAGAIVLGKLNTHEFAYGPTTTSPHFPGTHNPWALDRIVGGSSGGSGAAAAADLAAGTLGTDTAGSIRIPCSFCGASGVRPTTGRVSSRGMVPLSWAFDTIGPIARTAEDCALLLEAIAGHDPADPSTVDVPVPSYSRELAGGVRDLRIGVVSQLFEGAIDPRVAAAVEAAVGELRSLGARVEPVELPLLEQAGLVQQGIQFPEASTIHLEWLRTRLADYGPDVRVRFLLGLLLPPTTYVTAQRARRLVADGMRPAFERFDLLVAPTAPVIAPRLVDGRVELDAGALDPDPAVAENLFRRALIRYTGPWSLLGVPVTCVPCGFVDGMPVALALVGRRFGEAVALRAAHAYQTVTDWHERRPALAA